jgi:hypothetical protein
MASGCGRREDYAESVDPELCPSREAIISPAVTPTDRSPAFVTRTSASVTTMIK